jgi:hypothetical protein
MAKLNIWKPVRISRPIQGYTVRLCKHDPYAFDIYIFVDDWVGDFLASIVDQDSAVLEFEIWTKILKSELARSKGGFLDLEALYRAKDEWQARSDSS